MLPGKRCSAGGVRKAVSSASGSIVAIAAASSEPMRARSSYGPGERLLDGDLLVEREADQQRERVLRDEAVGVGVAGEREVVGRDGKAHRRIVRAGRPRRATRATTIRAMTMPAPFADTRGTLAIRAGRLLDVETGETLPDRTLLVRDARIEAVVGPERRPPRRHARRRPRRPHRPARA